MAGHGRERAPAGREGRTEFTAAAPDTAFAALLKAAPAERTWTFLTYRDEAGGWRWALRTPDGRIAARGEDTFTSHADVLTAIDQIRSGQVAQAPVEDMA
jgi:uncharacterized protein YegP (UPF0339 family)